MLNSLVSGPYPEPYLLVRTKTGIIATDLMTLDQKVVFSWMDTYEYGLNLDFKEKKLFFANKKRIYKSNLDGTESETILKNTSVNDIAIDWKGSRIFWNDYAGKEIFAADLDGTERKVVVKSETSYLMSVAIDPVAG